MANSREELPNYYEILEISQDVPQSEIQKAYHRAKMTYSQDNPALYSMFTREEARELLRLIEEAYTVLGNSATRQNYDDNLRTTRSKAANMSTSERTAPAHEDLPDFVIPEADEVGYEQSSTEEKAKPADTINRKTHSAIQSKEKAGTPAATNYRVDEKFEEEIRAASEFNGSFLQKIRLYKNISLDKVVDETRVSKAYLTAIEADDYAKLPAAVYVRGFIVNYARLLELDTVKVVDSFMKRFKAEVGKR
jgi:curved DNA-binding protein CbpA